MKNTLDQLGLNPDNSIVIGSGILQALNIRKSNDIDMVVNDETFDRLKKTGRFEVVEDDGKILLHDDLFEIGTGWPVLNKLYKLNDFDTNSTIIDGTRYITLDFIYEIKKHRAKPKDIEDLKLIDEYRNSQIR